MVVVVLRQEEYSCCSCLVNRRRERERECVARRGQHSICNFALSLDFQSFSRSKQTECIQMNANRIMRECVSVFLSVQELNTRKRTPAAAAAANTKGKKMQINHRVRVGRRTRKSCPTQLPTCQLEMRERERERWIPFQYFHCCYFFSVGAIYYGAPKVLLALEF